MSSPPEALPTVVIGGGIAGLTAALELQTAGRSVVLLEGSPTVGGKLRSASVAGVSVDVGAEAMLARRPEGVALAARLGLPLIHPSVTSSGVWSRGALRPLPRTLMGAPLSVPSLSDSGVLTPAGVARAAAESELPALATDEDVSVASLMGDRFGSEVVQRLVEPLLGGVYAGHAASLSACATVPQVVAMALRGSILSQASSLAAPSDSPVFAGVPGGLGVLPAHLASQGGFVVRTSSPVRSMRRTPIGIELVIGSAASPDVMQASSVVVATPAAASARLLASVAPVAAAELASIESASMAVVTLAVPLSSVQSLAGSGFLVPPVEGLRIKASTFSFNKWGLVHGDVAFLRTSVGRHREEETLQVSDSDLLALSLADLATVTGLSLRPIDAHVQRWGGGLPQYFVGHLDRVARIRAAVSEIPGLAVCGAAYDGVGIPAVIASAQRAAASLLRGE